MIFIGVIQLSLQNYLHISFLIHVGLFLFWLIGKLLSITLKSNIISISPFSAVHFTKFMKTDKTILYSCLSSIICYLLLNYFFSTIIITWLTVSLAVYFCKFEKELYDTKSDKFFGLLSCILFLPVLVWIHLPNIINKIKTPKQ